jgi:hypothetical protein
MARSNVSLSSCDWRSGVSEESTNWRRDDPANSCTTERWEDPQLIARILRKVWRLGIFSQVIPITDSRHYVWIEGLPLRINSRRKLRMKTNFLTIAH